MNGFFATCKTITDKAQKHLAFFGPEKVKQGLSSGVPDFKATGRTEPDSADAPPASFLWERL